MPGVSRRPVRSAGRTGPDPLRVTCSGLGCGRPFPFAAPAVPDAVAWAEWYAAERGDRRPADGRPTLAEAAFAGRWYEAAAAARPQLVRKAAGVDRALALFAVAVGLLTLPVVVAVGQKFRP